MLDFTSALYLGMRHASASLRAWQALSSGKPAALASPDGAEEVAGALAALTGCESGMLLPSTLHAFWDLFTIFPMEATFYVDEGVYPVARWGIERAAARGYRVRRFPHYEASALHALLERDARQGRQPIVVMDGLCPSCGRAAPLRALLESIRAHRGRVIIDDTQALGILGERGRVDAVQLSVTAPYGRGGGGILRWSGVGGDDIALVSSLAKGFGVPAAILVGSQALVREFTRHSATRVHCSPPSVAVVRAAERALAINGVRGDALRATLARRVQRFRDRVVRACGGTAGNLFPVQTLVCAATVGVDAQRLHGHLLRAGIRTVLHASCPARISFILTAAHSDGDIDRAALAVSRYVTQTPLAAGGAV